LPGSLFRLFLQVSLPASSATLVMSLFPTCLWLCASECCAPTGACRRRSAPPRPLFLDTVRLTSPLASGGGVEDDVSSTALLMTSTGQDEEKFT
jgi:hypothetical protein